MSGIEDPGMAGLPPEAFEPIEGAPTPEQLEVRIRAKREQAAQDAGWITSPQNEGDIEPIEPDEPSAAVVEEEPPPVETPEPVEPDAEPDEPDEPDVLPGEDEPDVEAEEADEPDAEEEQFFVGRYRTKEDAEAGNAEKDRLIAQLFRDKAERETSEQAEQGTSPDIDPQAWHEWAAAAVEEGGGVQGALTALERGGAQGYDIYISHWLQDEDPSSRAEALAFNNEVTRQFATQQAQLVAEHARRSETTHLQQAEAAKNAVAAKYPEFRDLEKEMDRLVVEPGALDDETKQWLHQTASTSIEGKQRAWEYLYLVASSTRAPARAKANGEERRRRRTSADAAKVAATVSSSEGTAVRTLPSAADLAMIRKRNGIREKAGLPLLAEE